MPAWLGLIIKAHDAILMAQVCWACAKSCFMRKKYDKVRINHQDDDLEDVYILQEDGEEYEPRCTVKECCSTFMLYTTYILCGIPIAICRLVIWLLTFGHCYPCRKLCGKEVTLHEELDLEMGPQSSGGTVIDISESKYLPIRNEGRFPKSPDGSSPRFASLLPQAQNNMQKELFLGEGLPSAPQTLRETLLSKSGNNIVPTIPPFKHVNSKGTLSPGHINSS